MLAFRNGFEYRNFDLQVLKGITFATFFCNFGEDRSTDTKDYAGNFCTFWDETAKIGDHTFSIADMSGIFQPIATKFCMVGVLWSSIH